MSWHQSIWSRKWKTTHLIGVNIFSHITDNGLISTYIYIYINSYNLTMKKMVKEL